MLWLSSQQDCISLALRAPFVSEASCPNFEPRAHARLTGLTNAMVIILFVDGCCTPRAPSRDFKSWGFAPNEGLTTSDETGDARSRFFESLITLCLRSRCDAREAMTVGCKPTILFAGLRTPLASLRLFHLLLTNRARRN